MTMTMTMTMAMTISVTITIVFIVTFRTQGTAYKTARTSGHKSITITSTNIPGDAIRGTHNARMQV